MASASKRNGVAVARRNPSLGRGKRRSLARGRSVLWLAAIGAVGVAIPAVGFRAPGSGPPASLDAPSSQATDAATLRQRVETDQGVLLVYDALAPAENPRASTGYLAYWRDYTTRTLYFYDQLLFTPRDVGRSVVAARRALGIDLDALRAQSETVARWIDGARKSARGAPRSPRVLASWKILTYEAASAAMGFEVGSVSAEGNGPQPECPPIPPQVSRKPVGRHVRSNRGNELVDVRLVAPPPSSTPLQRIDFTVENLLCPGGGGGGDPSCAGVNCDDGVFCTIDSCSSGLCNHIANCPGEPPLEAGSARPWEVEIPVSTYSTWHSRQGNTLTTIPIVSWSGLGPDMAMTLYHNAASVNSTLNLTAGMGFDLGPGWTVAYGSHLIQQDANTMIVVADDGTQNVFTLNATGSWNPPPGIHDELTQDATGGVWTLKHKNQTFHEYEEFGSAGTVRLRRIVDTTGQELSIIYSADATLTSQRIVSILTAGRQLDFLYDATDRLVEIKDPADGASLPLWADVPDRSWLLSYDTNGRLNKIRDPLSSENVITYDAAGRIASLSDKKTSAPNNSGDVYTYGYDALGRLETVTDPTPRVNPSSAPLTQAFAYASTNVPARTSGKYTDRRGNTWAFEYSTIGIFPDGNLAEIRNPLQQSKFFRFDAARNLDMFNDELLNTWTFTYDNRGNILSLTDPLLHQQTLTYDAINNVTSYTDAALHMAQFSYENPTFSTLLTSVTNAPGTTAEVVTTLTYDTSGQLSGGTAGEGVAFGFGYDARGQISSYTEGGINPATGLGRVMDTSCIYVHNSAGHLIAIKCSPCGVNQYDDMCNLTSSTCPVGCVNPPPCQCAAAPPPPAPPAGFSQVPCTEPTFPEISAGFTGARYTPKHELRYMPLTIKIKTQTPEAAVTRTFYRTHTATYDELGRLTMTSADTNEPTDGLAGVTRQFAYDYSEWASGRVTRTGPDGMQTVVEFDSAYRATSVTRGLPGQTPVMTATYTYLANGLVSKVDNGNFTSTLYTYDAAQRLTSIDHRDVVGGTILSLGYTYTANNLVAGITERDITNTVAARTTFGYDDRDQLISEVRTGQTPYDLAYVYDRSGNRLKKTETIDASTRMETTYTYDIEDATLYGSANNRLMKYIEERVTVNPPPGTGETRTLLATTFYYYNNEGNVTRVVTQKANPAPGEPMYSATRMAYALNGRAVTFVMGETWNDNMCPPTGYTVTYAREFRYDSPRQRYLNRELDPAKLQHPGDIIALSSTWTDYDGDYGYGDFTETAGVASERRAFIPGVAMVDPWTAAGGASTKYFHTNLIGTTRIMSGPTGNGDTPRVLTAFGEPVAGQSDRYGYAGEWGYQTHNDFPFLHVGARYYDPATGRFLQRDPIGIRGGLNVYTYAGNSPTIAVDPDGEFFGFLIAGVITVIAAVVVVIHHFVNLAHLVPDHSKDNDKDLDQLIQDQHNRPNDFSQVPDIVQNIARTAPGTSITGPSTPPSDVNDGLLDLALKCAGG